MYMMSRNYSHFLSPSKDGMHMPLYDKSYNELCGIRSALEGNGVTSRGLAQRGPARRQVPWEGVII